MNISIFGLGYVGCVSLGCLAEKGHQVTGVDISKLKVDQINAGKATIVENGIDELISAQHQAGRIRATNDPHEAVLNSEVTIVAVGTPSSSKGHLNLSYIFNVAEDIGITLKNKHDFHIVAIRSTIMPGTCDKIAEVIESKSGKVRNKDFAVVSNPEFLREGTALKDYYHPPLTLIGSDNEEAANTVGLLYKDLPSEIVITDLKVAEIMKYINNTYHALKVSFGNEVGNICKELGIDSHKVMEIFSKDTQLNISPYYFMPGFAYGGSCLPKDLKGLQTLAHDLYLDVPVIDSIHRTNEIQIQRAIDMLSNYRNKKLGFLGLSFKAGTDDLRNSPTVTVIETLIGKGYEVEIYDRNINIAMLTGTNKEYIDSRIPHLSSLIVENASTLIRDCDIIVINYKDKEFMELVRDLNDKIIFDFVRLDDSLIPRSNYFGLNW